MSSAIDQAITAMPEDFLIKPFLVAHRAEVKGMLLAEYNEVETMELFREEGREEGRQEGREEGRQEGREEGRQEGREEGLISSIKKMMNNLQFTTQQAMDALDIQGNDRQRYLSML